MEFWRKLNSASAAALGATLVAAAVAVGVDSAYGAPFSLTAAALWLTVGLALSLIHI